MTNNSNYNEVHGDLIALAKEGKFDVIVHGNNCFCNMGAGIAVAMAKEFGCNNYKLEDPATKGDMNKLGQIEFRPYQIPKVGYVTVVNAYTQYSPGIHLKPFDYEAMALCMRKMNYRFSGAHIGMPMIGAGLAGGDWERIKNIIQTELKDCNITVVIYKK